MLQDGWKIVRVLTVDRTEVEILIAEPDKQFLAPDGTGAFANDGSKALIGGRHFQFGSFIELEGDSRRWRRDGQLRNLYSDRFVNRGKCGQEVVIEVSRVMIAGEQHRLCAGLRSGVEPESERAIHLGDQANKLVT